MKKATAKKLLLKGMGVSAGITRGPVKIIQTRADFHKFCQGDILVTKLTDPSMTLIINQSIGIICEIGGMTSHPAIISRELGIPAVVNAKTATKILKDGMQIILNGTTGEIFLEP